MLFVRKKWKLLSLFIVIIFVSLGIHLGINTLSCQGLACLSLENRDQYKIEKIYEESKYLFRALYKKDNILLRIEIRPNSSSEEAEQAIQTQLVKIKGLFGDAASPYPGEISDVISCNEEYKPVYSTKQQNGIQVSYFTGFVNERLVFGSCTNDQIAYHDTLVMFYCDKQKKFYQVEIIVPHQDYLSSPEKYQQISNSIACRNNLSLFKN